MQVEPYTALASIYDDVMDYVDHEAWADYIDHLLDEHELEPKSALELGCGTGLFAQALLRRRSMHYTATDGSTDMLTIARERLSDRVVTRQLVFPGPAGKTTVDLCLLLYDGLNYLLTQKRLQELFDQVKSMLAPGGVFVFDQSTPANSINNAEFFEDEDELGNGSYVRRSSYDEETGLHTTRFEIATDDGDFEEEHVERAWPYGVVRTLLTESGWRILGAYDGFSFDEAHDEAERIHWIVTP